MFGKVYILVISAILSILIRIQGFHSVSLFFMLALIYLLYKNRDNYRFLLICILVFTFFYLNPFYFQPSPSIPTTNFINGSIASIPKYDGNKVSFEFTASNHKVQINYFAKTNKEKRELEEYLLVGMTCFFEGEYYQPQEARNYYSFNYKEYLKQKNIHFIYTPFSLSAVNCVEGRQSPYRLLQRYRQNGINYIMQHFPDGSKGLMVALIFGERGEIEHELLRSYQSLGVIHLLAVSGLHVGLISASLYFLLIRVGFTKERTIDLLMILLPIYMVISGAAPSVIRATAMSMIVLLSIKGKIKICPLDGISFICIGLLIINPYLLLHLGFQLSFLTSYSLIISANTIFPMYSNRIIQLLVVTSIAQLISFPIIVYHFYEISLWSIPLNLIYIPFITFFALPFSFISFFSHLLLGPISEFIIAFYHYLVTNAHKGLMYLMNVPYSTITLGKPPLYVVVFYYVTIGFNLCTVEKMKSLNHLIKSCSIFIMILLFHWHLPYLSNEGEITMIDVGQGDSIYIELPRRKAVYIIDTGGNVELRFRPEWQQREKIFDVGQDVLVPFLKAKGVRKIDKLILSHGHFDHIGGAEALMGEVPVRNLLYSAPPETEFEKNLLQGFDEIGTNITIVKKGDYWKRGIYEFFILSANRVTTNINDRSIVLFTRIGGKNWLFTGDLEAEGESRMVADFPDINVDILKVGHHGSNTSTTDALLKVTNPKYALISVGQNNRYGHPNQEVINRLEERNVKILRTDQLGAIRYRFKGEKGFFDTKVTK
ncbi:DNA internalization-related competence protein ComEC/Rec2 [Anaerobacillus alkalidiazotrophicus]|uniref:DNA internalization-related competence protein ComEC/Rec2 n=1 Tax=Anaerobacillus alkalidiazotrophicus TaxID=472963 RepID=UPI0009FFE9A9|nr:DNA internalization-related competence protein ComEC/Rec2 [Anaerobacillus alkalidiazotrophicus]